MKTLDEYCFIYALTQRDLEAREMKRKFKPEWLKQKELVPILRAMYSFLDEYNTVPSIESLHEYLQDQDKDKYEARYKTTLVALAVEPTQSKQIQAVEKAKEIAASLDLQAIIHNAEFQRSLAEGDGKSLMRDLSGWLTKFNTDITEETLDIKSALDKLIKETPWTGRAPRVATGIRPIDEWTYGGLRPGQLGIIMAPTGGGKSACLLNIAYHIALVEERQVLLLTNELTINEQTERFLARMQGKDESGNFTPLQVIQDDPVEAYRGLERKWVNNLEKRLYVGGLDLGATSTDIEALLIRLRAERGFSPEVIVVDFMEKMAPSSKINKEKEWIYLQEIAKELIRLGIRRRASIWTATQTNRGGLNRKIVQSMEYGQGSVRHFQEATSVVSVRKVFVDVDVDGNTKLECLEFMEHKQRHGQMSDRKMLVQSDLSRMLITENEVIVDNEEKVEDAEDRQVKQNEKKTEVDAKRKGATILAPWQARVGT